MKKSYLRSFNLKNKDKVNSNAYPFSIPTIHNLETLHFHHNVTFFVGENGTGKSTLLEAIAIACKLNPEGGSQNFNFSTNSTHSNLNEYISLTWNIQRPKDCFFLRAESFYNVCNEIEKLEVEKSYGGESLHLKSHGEAFIALIQNRFRGNGLYILDEPESALSPNRQMTMLANIHNLVLNNSQFIIATHSPIILAYPNAVIYSFDNNKINPIKYEDSEHYIVMRSFLNQREKFLKILINN